MKNILQLERGPKYLGVVFMCTKTGSTLSAHELSQSMTLERMLEDCSLNDEKGLLISLVVHFYVGTD